MLFLLFHQTAIQLDHRIATVEAVVAELAKKSGRDLRIKPEMRDEVLYVSLHAHPAGETMALVARAASAEWSEDGATYLGRSASLRNRQAREDRKARAAEIEAARHPFLVEDDARPWTDAAGKARAFSDFERSSVNVSNPTEGRLREARLLGMAPIGRMLSRALRSLPADELASVPRGEQVRFALRPTRSQRTLPAAAGFSQYLTERAAFALDVARLSAERDHPYLSMAYGPSSAGGETGLVPLLRVHRWGRGFYEVRIAVFDGCGKILDSTSLSLDPNRESAGSALPGYARWSGLPLKVGPECAAFVSGLMAGTPDPALAAKLRDPAGHEPLAPLMTDPMDALRDAMGATEAIVALPDEAGQGAGGQLESNPKIGEFADGLARDVRSEVKDGLWLGSARRPSEVTASKTSRALLGAFLREFRPIPSLDAVSQYALAQNPDAVLSGFESLVLMAAGEASDPDVFSRLLDSFGGGRNVLRAYGGLSAPQRKALEAGETIALGRTSPGVRASLERLVFRQTAELESSDPEVVPVDPTVLLDSLSPETALSFGKPQTESIAGYRLMGRLALMETGSLGYVLDNQEHDGGFDERGGYPMVAKASFVPGQKRSFTMDFQVSPVYRVRGYLHDCRLREGAGVPYDHLPPEHLAAFRKTYDYYRKMRGGG